MNDEQIEEQLKRIKKRDLFQTYFFKVSVKAFGPPKSRSRVIIAPPMPKLNCEPTFQVDVSRTTRTDWRPGTSNITGKVDSRNEMQDSSVDDGTLRDNFDWVMERKSFRKALDNVGDLAKWIRNKPTLTELELLVVEREKQSRKRRLPVQAFSIYLPDKVDGPALLLNQSHLVRSSATGEDLAAGLKPRSQQPGVEQPGGEPGNSRWEREGLKSNLHTSGKLEGEQGRTLQMTLPSVKGQDHLSPNSPRSKSQWPSTRPCGQWPLSLREREEQARVQQRRRERRKYISDEEALANLQAIRTGNERQDSHVSPSTLAGDHGRAVDRYRRQCLREHLDILDLCLAQGTPVNPARLERVLLHPGDYPLRHFNGSVSSEGWPISCHANPNEDVCVSLSASEALVHRIYYNPAPSPGNWPVNEEGYSTSGDIDGNKGYRLF